MSHGFINEVVEMIRNGENEKTVSDFIESLYRNNDISHKVYCVLLNIFIENF